MQNLTRILAFIFVGLPSPALACSICGGDFQNRQSLRQEANKAVVVVFGTLNNARVNPDSADGQGSTDLHIKRILKGAELLNGGNFITLPRYLPGDGKNTPSGIFFFEARSGHLAYLSGRIVNSERVADYVREAAALKDSDPVAMPRLMISLREMSSSWPTSAFVEGVIIGEGK